MGGEIFYHFLNKIFDRPEYEIIDILPLYLTELAKSKVLDQRSFTRGISRFLQALPNISSDYPKISLWFSQVMMILFEHDLLSFKELTWVKSSREADEEEPMVDDYFNLMAQFLMLLSAKTTNEKVIEFYDTYIRSQFSVMTKYIV